ncbi:MAG TPA: SUMF1/EgtB/PvdO family nonheme iron enzyme [Flavobacteriales bacterium]|nr:SUMF1/EgtB/PvdO family nonheme iron enzyme [Flavobacteriales bacterium]
MRTGIFILAFLLSISCFSQKKLKPKTYYHLKEEPPASVKLPNGLWVDETEITNFSWCEYMFWTTRIFGKNSPEYTACLPDTQVWLRTDSCLLDYARFYLKHPAYRDYPVVGISAQQAQAFCKWRSDRVFEYILIRDNRLEWNGNQTPESYFTIEKYFAGEYMDKIPDTSYHYIPSFSLPTMEEWFYTLKQNDSLEYEVFGKSRKHSLRQHWLTPFINADSPSCTDRLGLHATVPVTTRNFSKKINRYIYNLRGNVNELTLDGPVMGGSWKDSRRKIFESPIFFISLPTAYNGFRCVCHWVKVDEYIRELK